MIKLTGKHIEAWAAENKPKSEYYNKGFTYYEHGRYKTHKVTGGTVASKYNAIVKLIKETAGAAVLYPDHIKITYANGEAKINRDEFVNYFLVPLIHQNIGFSDTVKN